MEAGLQPRFAFAARDAHLIKAAVRAGAGIGLLAEMAVDPAAAEQDLRVIPLAGLLPRCTTWAVLRRDCVLRDCLIHLLGSLSGLTPVTLRRLVSGDVPLDTAFAGVRTWHDVARSLGKAIDRTPGALTRPGLQQVFRVLCEADRSERERVHA